MHECDVHQWVESETVPARVELRQAVHTILLAIGASQQLRTTMLIKGGILLAIRYQGQRYTRDIDFSTDRLYQDFDQERFLEEFANALRTAGNRLEYDLDCRVQSCLMQPRNNPEASFASLKIKIGYAPKHDTRRHQ